GQRERHVDRVDVLARELVEQRDRRAGDDRVLRLPAVLAEQIVFVDDLGPGPAELQIGEAHLALALGAREARRAREHAPRHADFQEVAPSHALIFGTPRSASSIFAAGYS